jgi:putative ABC transport system permease protein
MPWLTDLLFASRTLRAKPLFTAIAVASLALGIGANTAIFSVVESALLRELPYDHAGRLIQIRDHQPLFEQASIAPGEFLDYQRQTKTLTGMAAYTWQELTLTGNGDPQRLRAAATTANFFEVLGAHAERGRLFSTNLDKPGADRAVVLSDATWRALFASDPGILGRTIRLNGKPFHVVGVLRAKEDYPASIQIWVSPRFVVPEYVEDQHASTDTIAQTYGNHWLIGVGRMRPDVTLAQTRAELNIIAKRIGAAQQNAEGHYPNLVLLHENLVGDVQPALWVLLGAVVLLLLIACANLAGLLLSRSTARTRELAVRAALGATRWQIVRLLLAESLLLALGGGVIGVFLAGQGQLLLAKYSPYDLPAALGPQMDWQVLAFCLGTTLVSALLSGLVPALRSAHVDVQNGLKESAKGSASTGANRLRRLLVSAEIALSVVLLSSACLLIHSFTKILDVNPGFDATNVITARISLPLSRYSHESAGTFWNSLLQRVSALPDVESAAIVTDLPMSGGESGSEIRPLGLKEHVYSDQLGVSAGVFRAMRIPMLSGRTFDGRETEKSPSLAVVNRAFADKVFPNQNPIGKKFEGGPVDGVVTIIGVVGDVKTNGLSEPAPLLTYYSYPQYGVPSASIVVRTRGNSAGVITELRSVLRGLDDALPLSEVKPLGDYVGSSLAARRFLLGLLSGFAALAILLAGIGLYGVLAFSVEQRTREIGIRVALGAARSEVLQLILGECSLMALAGLGTGLLGAFWASSLLKNLLFGVTGTDYAAYFAAIVLVLGIACLAAFLPALRATRVDPVTALRYE